MATSEKQQIAALTELFDLVDLTDQQINDWAQVANIQDMITKLEQIGKQLREMQKISRYLVKHMND